MAPLTPLEQQQLHVTPSPTFWHRVRFGLVADHLAERTAQVVLDVGAGSGLLGEHLRTSAIAYRFSEASPALATGLRSRFGDDAFDDGGPIAADAVVALLDVIEHVEDDAALLASLAKRMESGAGIVLTVPAMRWLFSSWDTDLGHFRRYSKADLVALVEGAGLRVVEASYLFPELVPPALLRRFRRSDGAAAEFPTLPALLDRLLGVVGRATSRLRRLWPAGTSVYLVGTAP